MQIRDSWPKIVCLDLPDLWPKHNISLMFASLLWTMSTNSPRNIQFAHCIHLLMRASVHERHLGVMGSPSLWIPVSDEQPLCCDSWHNLPVSICLLTHFISSKAFVKIGLSSSSYVLHVLMLLSIGHWYIMSIIRVFLQDNILKSNQTVSLVATWWSLKVIASWWRTWLNLCQNWRLVPIHHKYQESRCN